MSRRLILGLFLISALASGQNTFYGATGAGGAASSLYTINSTTGATTLVGAIGFNGVGSLAFSPAGTLYAIAGNSGSAVNHQLITINTTTGAGTLVGLTGEADNITDISFRSDGVLFAMSGNAGLYSVSTTTGVATLLGTGPGIDSGGGLAFNSANTLFVASGDALNTVNQSNGAQSNVVTMTFVSGADSLIGMKFHPSSGTLYAAAFSLDSSPASQLVTVNTTTGAMASLGSNGVRLEAIAISGTVTAPPPPGIPVPSSLWLLGVGVFCLAGWRYFRQPTTHTA
jgi:WD40 repeat protein